MRQIHLLIIASFFGIIIVLAAAMILTSPALIPAPASTLSGEVKYGGDTQLPGPHYYTGIDFDTLKSDDNLTVIPLKSYRQQVTNYSCGAVAAMTVMSWYGNPVDNTDADEERVVREIYPNVTEKTGVNPEQVAAWFNRQGMNATWGRGAAAACFART